VPERAFTAEVEAVIAKEEGNPLGTSADSAPEAMRAVGRISLNDDPIEKLGPEEKNRLNMPGVSALPFNSLERYESATVLLGALAVCTT